MMKGNVRLEENHVTHNMWHDVYAAIFSLKKGGEDCCKNCKHVPTPWQMLEISPCIPKAVVIGF